MSTARSRLPYVPQLDGLRGAAIATVLLFHAELPLFTGGYFGVDVFFVLSGFLITMLLVREYDADGTVSLKNFYMRRVLRLAPALAVLLGAVCVFSRVVLPPEQASKNVVDALIAMCYLSNWAKAFLLYRPDIVGHTWSLSIEEQFYVLWPLLLVVLLRRVRWRGLITAAAAAIAAGSWLRRAWLLAHGATIERVYNGLDTRADGLMIGCALALLVCKLPQRAAADDDSPVRSLPAFAALVGLVVCCVHSDWRAPSTYYWKFVVVELCAAVLIYDVYRRPDSALGRLLATKPLVWVGSISYGLYLWHYPIFRGLQALGYGAVPVLLVGSSAALAAAVVSYYAVEAPVLRWKRRYGGASPEVAQHPVLSTPCSELASTSP